MSKQNILTLLFVLWGSMVINQTVFAHGYQTAPYSRIANTVDSGQKAQLNYNQNQISNNLSNNLGSKTLKQIMDYVSETNGTGPLAFYKDNYPVKSDQLCAYAANNQGYLPILNQPLPENKMTQVSAGDPVQFKWGYTAWHTPSNNFVFTTQYPAGKYKPNPSLSDLYFVCAVTADSSGAWQCKLPIFSGDAKQVLVTIWQRVDAAGENFISCADVKLENGTVVPPEIIWSLIDNKAPWTSALMEQPKAGDTVNFTLEAVNNANAQKSILAKYSLSITASNLSQWESILATKINNDTTYSKIIAIGQLNTAQGNIVYNQTDRNSNYVYLNTTISDPNTTYNYNLVIEKDSSPVVTSWQQIGVPLKTGVNAGTVKTNDRLQFAVQIAGVEYTLPALTVNSNTAEKLVADQVNKSEINGLKFAAGVLQGSGQQSNVQFVENGNNLVYVYRSSNDTRTISYVIRNLTQSTTYPVYPAGMGSYKAGSLVQSTEGQVYLCVEPGWCNLTAYGLTTTGAWKPVTPKAAPNGYVTYPAGQPYSKGSIVADIEGTLYKCSQAAWCNDKSGAYAPGTGRAWSISWEKQ